MTSQQQLLQIFPQTLRRLSRFFQNVDNFGDDYEKIICRAYFPDNSTTWHISPPFLDCSFVYITLKCPHNPVEFTGTQKFRKFGQKVDR